MQEIERKFLVDQKIWNPTGNGITIKQAYISNDPERTVRVRIADDKSFLTIKGKSEGISRTELEYEIPGDDAEALMKMAKKHPVEKTRFKQKYGGFTWEVDIFHGENKGLVLAEIELENEGQEFEKPDWVDEEVSGDKRYFNVYLSQHPYKTW